VKHLQSTNTNKHNTNTLTNTNAIQTNMNGICTNKYKCTNRYKQKQTQLKSTNMNAKAETSTKAIQTNTNASHPTPSHVKILNWTLQLIQTPAPYCIPQKLTIGSVWLQAKLTWYTKIWWPAKSWFHGPTFRVTRVGAKAPNRLFLEICGACFGLNRTNWRFFWRSVSLFWGAVFSNLRFFGKMLVVFAPAHLVTLPTLCILKLQ